MSVSLLTRGNGQLGPGVSFSTLRGGSLTLDYLDVKTLTAGTILVGDETLPDVYFFGQVPGTSIFGFACNPGSLSLLPGNGVLMDAGVAENFADGKGPGRPGDSQRHGIPKHATMAELEKASHAKGRKGQLARWQLNMRRGHKK